MPSGVGPVENFMVWIDEGRGPVTPPPARAAEVRGGAAPPVFILQDEGHDNSHVDAPGSPDEFKKINRDGRDEGISDLRLQLCNLQSLILYIPSVPVN